MPQAGKNINVPRDPAHNGLKIFLAVSALWLLAGGMLLAVYGDTFLFRYIHTRHNPAFDYFFKYYTLAGTAVVIIPVLLLIFWFRYRSRDFFLLLLATQIGSLLVNQAMKFWFAHPRPAAVSGGEPWFHRIAGEELHYANSFPSGHTAGAFAFFLFLAFLLPKRRAAWSILFIFLALLVAYSRIYLGQHFFSDVYAGSIEGMLICLCMLYFRRFRQKKRASI